MNFLKAEAQDNVSIVDMLHEALTIVEPSRPIGHIHASSLTSKKAFCPREVCLMKKLGRKPYPQTVDAPTQVTFHEGKDAQQRFNNDWMRHRMVGNWHCRNCGYLHEFMKDPKYCHNCKYGGGRSLEYREVVFFHPTGAQGSLDAILDVGKPKLRLVEFKILTLDVWENIKGPLAEHRARSKLYLELIRESNHPKKDTIDTERMHVIYKVRGFGRMDKEKKRISPFKEFIVHRDPQEAESYLVMAAIVNSSKESEWQLLPYGICPTMFETRAKACPVVKECFSGQYPSNL